MFDTEADFGKVALDLLLLVFILLEVVFWGGGVTGVVVVVIADVVDGIDVIDIAVAVEGGVWGWEHGAHLVLLVGLPVLVAVFWVLHLLGLVVIVIAVLDARLNGVVWWGLVDWRHGGWGGTGWVVPVWLVEPSSHDGNAGWQSLGLGRWRSADAHIQVRVEALVGLRMHRLGPLDHWRVNGVPGWKSVYNGSVSEER